MSLHLDKLPPAQRAWVGGKSIYLFSIHNEEWARNKESIRALNAMGGRPAAHIVETHSGLRAKDAPADAEGGLSRKTYIFRGARSMLSPAVWQK